MNKETSKNLQTSGVDLDENYKKETEALAQYSEDLYEFLKIYPSFIGSYLNSCIKKGEGIEKDDVKSSFEAKLIGKDEVSARLNNFYYFKIKSVGKDNKDQEDFQTLRQKSDSFMSCFQSAINVIDQELNPIISYGMACRNKHKFMFFGVQKSLVDSQERRDSNNADILQQIKNELSGKNYNIERIDDLFNHRDQSYFSGISFAIPQNSKTDVTNNQNNYNDLFDMENKNDFTLLILAKTINKKDYKERLSKIYTNIAKCTNVSKFFEKSVKVSNTISETNTIQEESSKVQVINKTFEIGSALSNQALGAVAGLTLGSTLIQIPVVGKKLAIVGAPILTILGAFLGAKYLKEMTEPYTKIVNETITKKHIDIKSITKTLTNEFGFSKGESYNEIDLYAKSIADEIKKAFDRFDANKPVWQTVITYSSPDKSVRNTLHGKICYSTDDDRNTFAYTETNELNYPEFLIPDNFFRTGADAVPSEYANFISGDELSSVLYLPTKSYPGEFEIE